MDRTTLLAFRRGGDHGGAGLIEVDAGVGPLELLGAASSFCGSFLGRLMFLLWVFLHFFFRGDLYFVGYYISRVSDVSIFSLFSFFGVFFEATLELACH